MLHSEFSWPVSGLRSYSRCALLLQAAGMEQVGGSGPAAVRRPNTTQTISSGRGGVVCSRSECLRDGPGVEPGCGAGSMG